MVFKIIFGGLTSKFDKSFCIAFLFKCDPICHLVINYGEMNFISEPESIFNLEKN